LCWALTGKSSTGNRKKETGTQGNRETGSAVTQYCKLTENWRGEKRGEEGEAFTPQVSRRLKNQALT
jgi:hypothetical protein